ncbi:nucleoside-diphosphate-sugar epimerase [Bacillus mesophilus]|uniref:UDP-glucose 4-epimerase n=1 Tax=Bacillus mesophilus TaxID=1808955 RepID=A0A6M0QC36_9BACI|nr:NAD-dependent epimerase/dehydratase family protein [Bacillus mesophilus]MBM7663149.1 nucleoside-diphosphate-sugar epimerase [Bacillus mesophilus]NEY73875.1 NAD-dependent epimerase/dehydratase family protein [Bacillus mesophilus]
MKSALVLGGTMFFGKRLVQLLIDRGVEVTIATRGKTEDSFGDVVKRISLDRTIKETIQQGLQGLNWDVVYDQTAYSPIEVKDVIDVLKGHVDQYIFTSTMAVYDHGLQRKEEDFISNNFNYELRERSQYIGISGYQEAKRACEAYLTRYSTVPVSFVRFPLVVGTDDYTNRLKVIVDRVKNNQEIHVYNLDLGLGFISSEKAAELLYWLGQTKQVGAWNGALDGYWTHRKLIEEIEEATGRGALVKEMEQPLPETTSPYAMAADWSVDAEKARLAGFKFGTIESVLRPLIEHYANND